jgi:hypothetical protein
MSAQLPADALAAEGHDADVIMRHVSSHNLVLLPRQSPGVNSRGFHMQQLKSSAVMLTGLLASILPSACLLVISVFIRSLRASIKLERTVKRY